MSVPKITCPRCNGKASIILPKEIQSSYVGLRKLGTATVAQLAKATNKELTLSHHFVRRLVALGLAKKVATKMPAKYAVS